MRGSRGFPLWCFLVFFVVGVFLVGFCFLGRSFPEILSTMSIVIYFLCQSFQKYCQLCRLFSAIRKSLIDEQFEPLFVTVTVNLWLNKGGEESSGPTDLEPRGLKTPGNVARSFIVPLQRVHLEPQRARLTDYSLMYKFGIAQSQRPPPVAKRLLAVVELPAPLGKVNSVYKRSPVRAWGENKK